MDNLNRIAKQHAQLIEATKLAEKIGHGRNAFNPESCELCASLISLRKQVDPKDQLAIAFIIRKETRQR